MRILEGLDAQKWLPSCTSRQYLSEKTSFIERGLGRPPLRGSKIGKLWT